VTRWPVALLDARGFRPEDFARSHPGGALGRKLLTLVEDVMRTGTQVPRVAPDTVFSDLMREMSAKGLGAAAVVDGQERPVGIFTDGDLRRRIEAGPTCARPRPPRSCMPGRAPLPTKHLPWTQPK
jgi:arabinose-5-phosphate isomerase